MAKRSRPALLDIVAKVALSVIRGARFASAILTFTAPAMNAQNVSGRGCIATNEDASSVSAARSVVIMERDSWNNIFFLHGNIQTSDSSGVAITARRPAHSAWPEVDPRSTLVVRFTRASLCAPPFRVRIRGAVRRQNGGVRSLEIPNYFQAGVAQAEPQSRAFAWASATRVLSGVPAELKAALVAAPQKALEELASIAGMSGKRKIAIDLISKNFRAAIDVEKQRFVIADSASQLSVNSALDERDSLRAKRTNLAGALVDLTIRLDSIAASQISALQAADSNDVETIRAIERRELIALLSVPETRLAVRILRTVPYRSSLREMAAKVETEQLVLDSLLAQLDIAFNAGDDALSKSALPTPFTNALVRSASDAIRRAERRMLDISSRVVDLKYFTKSEVSLLLPDAEIPLRMSSVAEGEHIALEITFVADDGGSLESVTFDFLALRLGGAVRNIRDVALFINRCVGGAGIGFCRSGGGATVEGTANRLRADFLGPSGTVYDALRLDAVQRTTDIPQEDRFVPSPGVVLEAVFRPRVLAEDNMARRIFKKTVRSLGVSAGLSINFVSYAERRITLNVPPIDEIRAYYADTNSLSRSARADTIFRLGATDLIRQELSIAPAFHLGVFDGAISWAFGANLRARQGRYFSAVGFSFIGLTEAGAKLLGSIKGS